ncbi:hypothetical protein Vadar_034198 [Vaccinium darrowii]|uniref:Uncharacterized protein n=1 Tax=Vaccinium darrowii TaxID=229202 RepID=A0ACB7XN04_9ERIC|nr:hypothetical protein Vadar_034198 [Vaccinium darrowii]
MEEEIINKLAAFDLTKEEEEVVLLSSEDFKTTKDECLLSALGKIITHKPINLGGLKSAMELAWGFPKGFKVMEVGGGVFQFVFGSETDLLRVLAGSPWLYNNHLVVLHRWIEDERIKPEKLAFDFSPFWIQLRDLPLEFMSVDVGRRMMSGLGEVQEIMVAQLNGNRGRCIRVKVELDIRKPLPRGKKGVVKENQYGAWLKASPVKFSGRQRSERKSEFSAAASSSDGVDKGRSENHAGHSNLLGKEGFLKIGKELTRSVSLGLVVGSAGLDDVGQIKGLRLEGPGIGISDGPTANEPKIIGDHNIVAQVLTDGGGKAHSVGSNNEPIEQMMEDQSVKLGPPSKHVTSETIHENADLNLTEDCEIDYLRVKEGVAVLPGHNGVNAVAVDAQGIGNFGKSQPGVRRGMSGRGRKKNVLQGNKRSVSEGERGARSSVSAKRKIELQLVDVCIAEGAMDGRAKKQKMGQGLGRALTANQLKELCKFHSPQLVFLAETKNQFCRIDFVRRLIGMDGFQFVDPVGIAGGLVVYWKKELKVRFIHRSSFFIELLISDEVTGLEWHLINLYASSNYVTRKAQWEEMLKYRQQCSELGAIDMGFSGYPFTWINRRYGDGLIKEWLDRVLVSPNWRLRYDRAVVRHLAIVGSDHAALLLDTDPPVHKGLRQFRFHSRWCKDPETYEVVRQGWKSTAKGSKMFEVFHKIKSCRQNLRSWSKQKGFNARRKINQLQERLELTRTGQCIVEHNQVRDLEKELGDAWIQEEAFWRQKSRADWMALGDRNTSFFHSKVNQRRKRNRITGIQRANGTWCEEPNGIAEEFVDYFQNLFQSEGTFNVEEVLCTIQGQVTDQMNVMLTKEVNRAEIQKALWDMNPTKALGADGMTAGFYQTYWGTVGEDVIGAVQNFFQTGHLLRSLNHTHIVLIPKKASPVYFALRRSKEL